jgi:hypothetical protein
MDCCGYYKKLINEVILYLVVNQIVELAVSLCLGDIDFIFMSITINMYPFKFETIIGTT